jgi:cytidylate kinase
VTAEDRVPIVIAIDGPTASGKGTLARRLAEALDFAHLDTGLLYRAIGRDVVAAGGDPGDVAAATAAAHAFDGRQLNDPILRDEAIAAAASKVSAIPGVRAAILGFQRRFCRCPPRGKRGAVLDGRDIGTVVWPESQAKIFVDASVVARARRRVQELRGRGKAAIPSDVQRDLMERDARDRNRAVSPLVCAADAYTLDTSDLDADQAFAAALAYVKTRIPGI